MQAAARAPIYAELLSSAEARLRAAAIETARLDAEVLLAHAAAADRSALYARLQRPAAAELERDFAALVARRERREPIAYITGVQEFWSLPFAVTPAVLIPRPETELLVEVACRIARGSPLPPEEGEGIRQPGGDTGGASSGRGSFISSPHLASPGGRGTQICDVGTGSGCIAIALARELPQARIVATDVSADALAVAARNAATHGVGERISFARGDLFDAVDSRDRFDLIVSNPPYLAPGDRVAPEVACEPDTALAAGADGLAVIRRLIATAADHLCDNGYLVMELGCGQDQAVRALAEAAEWTDIAIEPDLAGIPRALVTRRAPRGRRWA